MISLSNIKPNKKSTSVKRRIGRGNGSGRGNYSGKGIKGQNSRSGVSNQKRMGLKSILFKIPKKRGFTSKKVDDQVVYTSDLNNNFKSGDIVNPESLERVGLVKNQKNIKLILKGALKLKDLKVDGVKMSASVAELIK